jgi:hypothetical protein
MENLIPYWPNQHHPPNIQNGAPYKMKPRIQKNACVHLFACVYASACTIPKVESYVVPVLGNIECIFSFMNAEIAIISGLFFIIICFVHANEKTHSSSPLIPQNRILPTFTPFLVVH